MSKKIKIAWIASCAPFNAAPAAGGQTFNYYIKQFMNDSRFEIRLICWGDISKKKEIELENSKIKHNVIYTDPSLKSKLRKIANIESSLNLFNRNANLISNYCSGQMLKTLKAYKDEGFIPDFIILEWSNTVVLANEVKKIFPSTKIVASEHDVTFVGYGRKKDYFKGLKKLIWNIKYWQEKRVEIRALELCDYIVPHNRDNIDILVNAGIPRNKLKWLIPFFHDMSNCVRNSNKRDIMFFGAMHRPENYLSALWFIENVFSRLEDLPLRFVILGSNPPEQVKKYENERIRVTGYVESFQPYFEKSMCMVAPLVLGAGIKVKVLEALSSGIPLLTNDIGIEGIPAREDYEYFHCKKPKEYEDIIRKIYKNELDVKYLEKNSKCLINKYFSLEKSFEQYVELLESQIE